MASDPYLRQVPERLRVSASALTRGPVRKPLLAFLPVELFNGLPAATQLARLLRSGKAPLKQMVCSLDPNVRVA